MPRSRIKTSGESGALVVELEIQPGWHINAHKPLSENLVATTLEAVTEPLAWRLTDTSYPRPITKSLGFQSEALALYEDTTLVTKFGVFF